MAMFIYFALAWKKFKSVSKDLSLLIKMSSLKLHNAPLIKPQASQVLKIHLCYYNDLIDIWNYLNVFI